MHPVFFTIFGYEVRFYGLMYALAFVIGSELAKRYGKREGIDVAIIDNYVYVAMLSGLIGGRLYYVLFNLPYYSTHPGDILAVWKGGMAIHGGILGGIVGTFIFAKKYNLSPWALGDIVAPSFILGQAIGRIGNFTNGEVHGVPTYTPWNVIFEIKPKFYDWYNAYQGFSIELQSKFKELVPWGMVFPNSSPAGTEFPNQPLHPAMLYELILNFGAFLFLWFHLRNKKLATGSVWWSYIILYSLIRTFVSFFRSEDLMFFEFRAPHVISLVLITISIIILKKINKKN